MSTTQAELWALQKKAHQANVIAGDLRARADREDERAEEYRKQLGHDEPLSTERDELAEVIRGIDGPATLGGLEVADAILAAGYSKHSAELASVRRAAKTLTDGRVIPDEAVEAALVAWGGCPVGTSPKAQVIRMLEAATPILLSHEADRARLERIESPWGNR